MSIQFNRATKIATIPIADGNSITVQSVYNQFKDFEDEPRSMDLKRMIKAGGKDFIAVGRETVITMTLLDGWLLAFEDRPGPAFELMTVDDGNIVALDAAGVPQYPISQTAFTSVSIAQATTGAVISGVGTTATEIWEHVPPTPLVAGSTGEMLFKKVAKFAEMIGLIRR